MKPYFWVLIAGLLFASIAFGQGPSDLDKALEKGADFEKANKYDEALQVYKEALQAFPSEELYRNLAVRLWSRGQHDHALSLLKEGMQRFPESTRLMNLAGVSNFKMGDPASAIALWKSVLEKDPKNSEAMAWIAEIEKPVRAKTTDFSISGAKQALTEAANALDAGDMSTFQLYVADSLRQEGPPPPQDVMTALAQAFRNARLVKVESREVLSWEMTLNGEQVPFQMILQRGEWRIY